MAFLNLDFTLLLGSRSRLNELSLPYRAAIIDGRIRPLGFVSVVKVYFFDPTMFGSWV